MAVLPLLPAAFGVVGSAKHCRSIFCTATVVVTPALLAQACLDTVLPYCHERTQFGQRIGEFQVGEAGCKVKAADALALPGCSSPWL